MNSDTLPPVVDTIVAALRAGELSMDLDTFAHRQRWSTRQVWLLAQHSGLPIRLVPKPGEVGSHQARVFMHEYILWAMALQKSVPGRRGGRPKKPHRLLEELVSGSGLPEDRTANVQAGGMQEKDGQAA